ncbi:hypothetical protein [Haliscomenobacter sp.]|uniref:hypothetical protein n=1 Tax=Haliscomenobacter sp. TaxID=2717303 RepID=UPI003BA9DB22
MRTLLFLGIVILYSACDLINRKPPTGFYQKEIVLSNYEEEGLLGKLSIYVPNRYNTLLDWDDRSDCRCCGSKKYRLLNKNSCLIQESGFIYKEICRDSFDRLSVVYYCQKKEDLHPEVDNTFLLGLASDLEKKIEYATVDEPVKWKAKKIIQINNQPYLFLHFVSRNLYSQTPAQQIYAGTFFNKTLILFIYENNQRDRSVFLKEAFTSIQSIKLSTI